MRYWVEVILQMSDEVEANSPEEAFDILSPTIEKYLSQS